MTFDNRYAFAEGREAAGHFTTWCPGLDLADVFGKLVGDAELGRDLVEHARQHGTPAHVGRMMKAFYAGWFKFMRQDPVNGSRFISETSLMNLPAADQLGVDLVRAMISPYRDEHAVAEMQEAHTLKLKEEGTPLDDLLAGETQPEDAYWLRGFEDKLRERSAA